MRGVQINERLLADVNGQVSAKMITRKRSATIALIFGVGSVAVPMLYGLGGSLLMLAFKRPVLPVPLAFYAFLVMYASVTTLAIVCGVAGLTLRPRLWDKDAIKSAGGLSLAIFSLGYFGTLIFLQ